MSRFHESIDRDAPVLRPFRSRPSLQAPAAARLHAAMATTEHPAMAMAASPRLPSRIDISRLQSCKNNIAGHFRLFEEGINSRAPPFSHIGKTVLHKLANFRTNFLEPPAAFCGIIQKNGPGAMTAPRPCVNANASIAFPRYCTPTLKRFGGSRGDWTPPRACAPTSPQRLAAIEGFTDRPPCRRSPRTAAPRH